ncbi:hypothetical protein C5S39_01590 [Candidatus Methanophagaceae archaeon]|nr:hypothetical protein C5S39_01590 [Methanophagales archaeon]
MPSGIAANIPRYDEYGLWHYEAASFSRFGTLKSTISSIDQNPDYNAFWGAMHFNGFNKLQSYAKNINE